MLKGRASVESETAGATELGYGSGGKRSREAGGLVMWTVGDDTVCDGMSSILKTMIR